MKRELVFAYDRLVPDVIKATIPLRLRAAVTGKLFDITRHPDFAFRHIKQLRASGQLHKAVALYADPNAVGTLQQTFRDPLFDCEITAPSDVLFGDFGYRGLLVSIDLKAASNSTAQALNLVLNGGVIRTEKMPDTTSKKRLPFIIGREALSEFPVSATLSLSDSTGAQLGQPMHVRVPHGTGTLANTISVRGPLEKKGGLRPDAGEVSLRQDQFLGLYERAKEALAQEGIPLLILYGTLLGQHRSGDFIPGDDDFDVGYPSNGTSPEAVKAEAIKIIETLVAKGFLISLNAEGKPFRISDTQAGPQIWLDNRPVFSLNDNHVWLHKHARLSMPLCDFWKPTHGTLRKTSVLKPANTEAFLAGYYGPSWEIPDPSFSNASKRPSAELLDTLAKTCLTLAEKKEVKSRVNRLSYPGSFEPLALTPLYPLPA